MPKRYNRKRYQNGGRINQPHHTHQRQSMAGTRGSGEYTDREGRVTGNNFNAPPDSGRRLTGGRSECNIGEIELWGVCYDPATTTSINRLDEDFGDAGNGNHPIPVSGPNSILYLQNLEWINIYRCNITGPIPHQLGQLPNLTGLYLLGPSGPNVQWDTTNYVGLTGTIPDSLTNLTNLTGLSIAKWPGIHGTIPQGFESCPYLYYVQLDENCLSGEIPSGLLNHPMLASLGLGFNGYSNNNNPGSHVCNQLGTGGFTGAPFSSVPMQNSNLKWINWTQNKLTGTIEPIGEMPLLESARLSGNDFGGHLSYDFCNFFTKFGCYETDCDAYSDDGNWIQNGPYLSMGGNNICPPFPQCITEDWGHGQGGSQGQCMYETGDVNQDGFVDVLDIVTTIQYILGDVIFNEVQMHFADMNQDGQINITDVVGMIQHISYNYPLPAGQRTELMNLLNQVQSGNLRGASKYQPTSTAGAARGYAPPNPSNRTNHRRGYRLPTGTTYKNGGRVQPKAGPKHLRRK